MRGFKWGIIILFLMVWGTACAPRQIKPVAAIDPAPLLERINTRRIAFEQGISGSLELTYKNSKKRFRGRVYVVAFPDGRFRLEVPGPFGGTHVVMVNDNTEILAFYPGEGMAFRSAVDGRSLNPHLPFPLPVDPAILPALIMGVLPEGDGVSTTEAYLLDSGEKLLSTGAEGSGLHFTWLFDKTDKDRLRKITVRDRDMDVSVHTRLQPEYLPLDFNITLASGVFKGEWDSIEFFGGDEAAFGLRLPTSITVTDLEASP